jgi:uncharacterized membrane protein HdeD (DUF308 family)
MLQLLFRKWWVVLLQGILLIALSIYIFNRPLDVLAGISIWFGLLVFGAGILGIIGWFSAEKSEQEPGSILWSIASVLLGVLMLFNVLATMKVVTVVFGIWMFATGWFLTKLGWSLKDKHSFGWIMVIAGIFSLIAAIMVVFNIGTGAVGISILLGLQVLFTGIALVLFSLAKKALGAKLKDKVAGFKDELR